MIADTIEALVAVGLILCIGGFAAVGAVTLAVEARDAIARRRDRNRCRRRTIIVTQQGQEPRRA